MLVWQFSDSSSQCDHTSGSMYAWNFRELLTLLALNEERLFKPAQYHFSKGLVIRDSLSNFLQSKQSTMNH